MAKIADSSIDGELTIEVKATLTVDEDTFNTCVNIMTIYAREHGIKGMTTGDILLKKAIFGSPMRQGGK